MGRVAGSYGVRGWMKVAPGGGALEILPEVAEWWIAGRAYRVSEARVHSSTVVAKLEGLETREQVLVLKGAAIAVERTALPQIKEEGRYYLADLVGLDVVNEQGEPLGRVAKWITNGAQDVMELAGERTRLIPWVSAIVKEVDLGARRIVVEWGADW
jgi:16S rRNA processing protein RimM